MAARPGRSRRAFRNRAGWVVSLAAARLPVPRLPVPLPVSLLPVPLLWVPLTATLRAGWLVRVVAALTVRRLIHLSFSDLDT